MSLGLPTTPPGNDLTNGMVFCRVTSWLTGSRWVSVPFSDHCDPLIDRTEDLHSILDWVVQESTRARTRYVEIKPLDSGLRLEGSTRFRRSEEFRIHLLDLGPSVEELYRSFDKSSIGKGFKKQRKRGWLRGGIFASAAEEVLPPDGHDAPRHRIPPQPVAWYSNLYTLLGDKARIRVVSKDSVQDGKYNDRMTIINLDL